MRKRRVRALVTSCALIASAVGAAPGAATQRPEVTAARGLPAPLLHAAAAITAHTNRSERVRTTSG